MRWQYDIPGRPVRSAILLVVVLAIFLPQGGSRPLQAAESDSLWQALRSGEAVAMMRHALAPGIGDPASFDIDDCTTQRNLSDIGRAQAKRVGDRLRENGVVGATVQSSAWCRCLETADLLGFGKVLPLPALNSFFRAREREEGQTAELKEWLENRPKGTPAILVTHQVNITALTGVFPVSGEIVVLRLKSNGDTKVLGTIRPQEDANTGRCDCGEDDQ